MARSKWMPFVSQQALQRAADKLAPPPPPSSADGKKFGLENFGNTCYANSVLQALYFCTPFRDLLLQDAESFHQPDPSPPTQQSSSKPASNIAPVRRKPERKPSTPGDALTGALQSPYPIPSQPPTLYSALRSLFLNISTNPGKKGSVAPRAFIDKLKELNELFRSTMHQDAHEFLNYLLNRIVEEIEEERKHYSNGHMEDLSSSVPTLGSRNPPTVVTTTNSSSSGSHTQGATLVHKLFEGTLTSETRCLTCETVSSRDESFLDLSIDIEQNSSVTACLRQFSASEMLCQRNKFFCDACCDLQEAEKRMKIKKLPNVLALHLKRFKYQEDVGRYIKLAYRVAFPFELRLFNTVDDIEDVDRLYKLFAIVVHIGNGPHQGHYVSIIKTAGSWFVFDDETVSSIPEGDIPKYFGDSLSGSAYVLYYQAVDIDLASLGLKPADSTPGAASNAVPYTPTTLAEHAEHILPPGLNIPSNPRPESIQLSPSGNSSGRASIPSAEIPNPSASVPPLTLQPSDNDASAHASPSTPLTPTGIGTRIMHTIRRVPSMSTTVDRPETRRSISERSPIASSSTPSLGPLVDTSTPLEAPPPVPPLPSNLGNISSPRQQPLLSPHPPDQEKEKEKGKGSGWPMFKKRKSIRAIEKAHVEFVTPSDLPPSHIHKTGEDSGSHRFKPSSPIAPRLQRRPSDSVSPINGHGHLAPLESPPATPHDDPGRLSPLNGDSRRPSTGSRSPSPVSASRTSQTSSRPLTADGTSNSRRKPSLFPLDRARGTFERKKSLDFNAMSPTSSNWPHASLPQSQPDYQRNLPPLPSTPKHHRNSPSNGGVHMPTELPSPTRPYDAHDGSTATASSPWQSSFPSVTNPSTTTNLQPPLSIGTAQTNSSGSDNSASLASGMKRATRKLSFTAPFFGRKDKDKERQREKERLSPATAGYAKG